MKISQPGRDLRRSQGRVIAEFRPCTRPCPVDQYHSYMGAKLDTVFQMQFREEENGTCSGQQLFGPQEDLKGSSHENHKVQHLFLCLIIFCLKFFHLLIKNLHFGWLMLMHFVVFTNLEHRRAIGLGSTK